jgi:dolichyl-phosphate-mannose-protein mannosyltransferase
MKCVLSCSGKLLPKWGFEQQEISCNPTTRDPNALWNVEDNFFPKCNFPFFFYFLNYFKQDLIFHLPISLPQWPM